MSKASNDIFHNLKYMAYCLSQSPPQDTTMEDFVQFAKFRLCESRGYLMEDPIWDRYKEEQIIVEYFAMSFMQNEEFVKEFERDSSIKRNGSDAAATEDALEWFEQQIEANRKELELEDQAEEEFEFSPNQIGD